MTEAEARKMWCPMVRVGLTAGVAVNVHPCDDAKDKITRAEGVVEETRCKASDCMMWRNDAEGDGYCGLAGPPQWPMLMAGPK